MITVRFASGFSVQYNSATFAQWDRVDGVTRLYTSRAALDRGDCPIARVPREALIEFAEPCRAYQAGEAEALEVVRRLEREVAGLKRALKRKGVVG